MRCRHEKQNALTTTSSFSMLRRWIRNNNSQADEKIIERIITKSPTHRSRSPKGMTKLPLAAERITGAVVNGSVKGKGDFHVRFCG